MMKLPVHVHRNIYMRSFTVYGRKQTDIHTTSANTVTLVRGSLRLAPIARTINEPHLDAYSATTKYNKSCSWRKELGVGS